MTTVTCVITSYDNMPFLEEAIDSVLAQTRPVDEILIADDGSTDGSRALIGAKAAAHPSIRPVLRERNLGVAANRDLALHRASGDLVSTLDGDDAMMPGKIAGEVAALEGANRPGDGVAYSDVELVDRDGARLDVWRLEVFGTLAPAERMKWMALRFGPFPRDMTMPKRTYVESGGLDHAIARYEDWDLKLRLGHLGWTGTGAIGMRYRRHGGGLSNADALDHLYWQYHVLMKNRAAIEAIGNAPLFRKAVLSRISDTVDWK